MGICSTDNRGRVYSPKGITPILAILQKLAASLENCVAHIHQKFSFARGIPLKTRELDLNVICLPL